MSWGYHLMLDCGDCDLAKMQDKENITKWIKCLVTDIDMIPVGEPYVEYVGEDKPEVAGFTACQVIVTSHITAHLVDKTRQIYLDVFSCKKFDRHLVRESVIRHFGSNTFNEYFITRQAD